MHFQTTIKKGSKGLMQSIIHIIQQFHFHLLSHPLCLIALQNTKMSPSFFSVLLLYITMASGADLQLGYYSKTCPKAESIVRDAMTKAMLKEPRSLASVMRFQFHDCFVNVSLIQLNTNFLSIFFLDL